MDSGHLNVAPLTEVLICAVGCQLKKEVLIAAQHFWDLGVAADIFQDASQALDDVKIHCHKNKIPYLLTLTAKDENQKEWTLIKVSLSLSCFSVFCICTLPSFLSLSHCLDLAISLSLQLYHSFSVSVV